MGRTVETILPLDNDDVIVPSQTTVLNVESHRQKDRLVLDIGQSTAVELVKSYLARVDEVDHTFPLS